MKQTFKEAGYQFIQKTRQGEYILLNLHTDKKEVFFANKHHASWGLKYKNTHLEFAHSLD